MASPATSYRITAVVEGLEKIEALKQTIRLLGSTSSTAADAVAELRKDALDLGLAVNASTKDMRTAAGALRSLQSVVDATGSDFAELARDASTVEGRIASVSSGVKLLRDAAAPTAAEVKRLRDAAIALGTASNVTEKELRESISTLQGLKSQTSITSAAYREFANDIQLVSSRLNAATSSAQSFTAAQRAATQNPFTLSGAGRNRGQADAGFGVQGPQQLNYGQVNQGLDQLNGAYDAMDAVHRRRRQDLVDTQLKYDKIEFDTQEQANKDKWQQFIEGDQKTQDIAAQIEKLKLQPDVNTGTARRQAIEQANAQMTDALAQAERIYNEANERQLKAEAKKNAELDKLRDEEVRKNLKSNEELVRNQIAADERTMQARARRRQRIANFGQSFGAVAASGVFGGPEGAIGAGIGAALGGPGTALAGGAIGAQVGMARQQLGGMSTYAADIEKQRIALRLIIKDTDSYNSALEFLNKTSQQYAIPQDRLIKGFTQVSASVIGAGGNIQDAKTAFEGITAGIRGTGRSLDDLDGALLATAQVFSKGKVSAEELRGQIGERLPGAYNLFAKALGRTPQELDKALERGEVTLADFMQFSKQVFEEYAKNAKTIAASDEAAGDRLTNTWKGVSEQIGKALLPVGAQIQNALGALLKELTPTFISLAKDLAAVVKLIADNFGAISNLVKFAAQMAIVNIAMNTFKAHQSGISKVFLAIEQGGIRAGAAAAGATVKVRALTTALRGLAAIGVITIGIELVVNEIRKVLDNAKSLQNSYAASTSKSLAEQYKDQTKEELAASKAAAAKNLANDQKLLKNLQLERGLQEAAAGSAMDMPLGSSNTKLTAIEQRIKTNQARIGFLNQQLQKTTKPANSLKPSLLDTAQPTPAGAAGEDKVDKAAKAAADLAAQQQRLNEENAKAQIELDDRRFQHGQENARRLYEFQLELDRKQRDNWVKMQTGAARTAAGLASSYFAQLEDLQAKRFDAQQKYEAAQQQQKSQTQIAAVTAAGAETAAPSSSNAVSRLFEAANSKLGLFAGQTERCADAIRELFKVAGIAIGTTKKAWDGLGSGPSLASSFFGSDIGQRINKKEDLRKGDLVGFDRTYGSWAKGVQTHVGMYAGDGMMYDHSSRRGLTKRPLDTFAGKFLYGVRPNALAGGTPGQNAQQRRSVATAGEAQERGLDVAQADAAKKATELENPARQLAIDIGLVADYTDSLRTQNAELKNSAQLTQQRNRLELEGVRPELIDAEDKKLAKTLEVQQANQGLTASLNEAKIRYTENSEEYKKAALIFEEAKAKQSGYLQEFVQLTDQAAAAQIAYNDALVKVNIAREGAKTISDGFKGFLKTAITGGDIQDAAKQMATSIRDKFLDMALDAAFKPFEEMLFKGFKDAMGLNKPADAATQAANTQLDAAGKMNAAADKMLNAASGTAVGDMSSLALPGFPDGVPSYAQALATPTNFAATASSSSFGSLGFDPSAAFGVATDAGTAFATSMSQVNDSLAKAPTAAQEANKGMQNFLGGMAGVAAGAMAIAGGIQQIGKGGTSNVLGGIGSVLLGLGGALGGLNGMGLFGKRAAGGPVAAQRPYMVGERGPELFMPSTSGSIGATSALREAMASGGSSGGSPVLNMSFQSTNIGGTEYVSRDQLEQAMAETRRSASRDGAKRGMSMTLDRLQQSPGTRSRVGIR